MLACTYTSRSWHSSNISDVEGWRVWSNLDDGWASDDIGVGQIARVIIGQENVALSGEHHWDWDHDHAVGNTLGCNGYDLEAANKGGIVGTSGNRFGLEIDKGAWRSWLS